ncbi:helix-turn-helix domain-containing protein [Streptomyces sp. NPDC002692]
MRWQLRLRAAERGVFKAVEMRRPLAQAGLPVSAGKMSALWSTTVTPVSIRLDDLDIICRVLGCDAAGLPVQDLPPRAPPLLLAADTVGETWPWNDSWPLQRPHPPLHATRLSPVHPTPPPPTRPLPPTPGPQHPGDAREFVRGLGRPRVCPGCGVRPRAGPSADARA